MEAPVFRPTPEQFADPIAFIKMIQPLVEQTGICRIVPPQEVWDSEVFKRNVNPNTFSFSTKRQAVHQMVNRKGPNVIFTKKLKMFWKNVKKSPLKQTPEVESRPLDWYKLHLEVSKRGGIGMVRRDFRFLVRGCASFWVIL
jgi:histone demethylase JARID1